MMKHAMVAVIAVALLVAAPAALGNVTKSYVGATGDLYTLCEAEEATGYCIGGVEFFGLPGGKVTVTINDNTLSPVGGAYGWGSGSIDFCGTTDIPNFPGDRLEVWVDGPLYGTGLGVLGTTCPDVQVGTEGTVTVTF